MNEPTEKTPTTVPFTATQVGEVRARWAWAEPSVWTDRMLTALEQGVKGGTWFSLIDKVYSAANLYASFTKVAANGGAAGVSSTATPPFLVNSTGGFACVCAAFCAGERVAAVGVGGRIIIAGRTPTLPSTGCLA